MYFANTSNIKKKLKYNRRRETAEIMGNSLTRLFTRQHICPCQGQQPEYVEPEPILICSDRNCEHSVVADAGPTTSDNYDFLVKLTVIGPSLVGKTKLCAVTTNEYKGSRRYEATIGVEFTTFRIRHNQHTQDAVVGYRWKGWTEEYCS